MSKNPNLDEYRAARADLDRISRRDRTETDAYLAANDRVAEAERNVPWWRR